MKKRLLFQASFLIIIIPSIFAQKKFSQDYIITNSRDTIYGAFKTRKGIDYKSATAFLPVGESVEQAYTPKDIFAFVENERYYVSAEVELENSSHKSFQLSNIPDFNISREHVFLLQLVEGPKELYKCIDDKGKSNFFIEDNEVYISLMYRRYSRYINDQREVFVQDSFKTQLDKYLDHYFLHDEIFALSYNQEDLLSIFKKYYESLNLSVDQFYNAKAEQRRFKYGASVGAGLVTGDIWGTPSITLNGTAMTYSISPYVGIFSEFKLLRKKENFIIKGELNYFQFHVTDVKTYTITADFAGQIYSGVILLKYQNNFKNAPLYFEAGMQYSSIQNKDYACFYVEAFSDTRMHDLVTGKNLSISHAPVFGFGVNANSFDVGFRYVPRFDIIAYSGLFAHLNSGYAYFAVKF